MSTERTRSSNRRSPTAAPTVVTVLLAWAMAPPVLSARAVPFQETFQGREVAVWVPYEDGSPVPGPLPLLLVFPGGTQTVQRMEETVCPTGEPGVEPATGAPLDPDCLHHVAGRTTPPMLVAYVSGVWDGEHPLTHTFDAGRCCGYAREVDADDVGFVAALLGWLEGRYQHDPARVYATGVSNGAMLAHRLGCELSEEVAAVAAVAGGIGLESYFPPCGPGVPEPCDPPPLHPETAFKSCEPSRPVPVVLFHGTADERQPYEGGRGNGLTDTYFLAVAETVEVWLEAHGCRTDLPPAEVELPNRVDETRLDPPQPVDSTVTRQTWDCREPGDRAGPVVYRIDGGGHAWPGGRPRPFGDNPTNYDVSAAREMLAFFSSRAGGPAPEECPAGYVTDPEVPGFCVRVEIAPASADPVADPVAGVKMADCLPETLCFHGAVPDRAEVFVRIVGPKPNGRLWPTLVKFTTSEVEVRILQLSSGLERGYTLPGARPGVGELPGLFDRDGFPPE